MHRIWMNRLSKTAFYGLLSLFMLCSAANAQDQFRVEVRPGLGTFSMDQLKDLLQFQNANNGIDSKVTEEFPAYYTFAVSVSAEFFQNIRFGLSIDYMSTGGRVHYSDFSGEFSIKHLVNSVQYAAIAEFVKRQSELFEFSLGLQFALINTSLDFENRLAIGTLVTNSFEALKSLGIGVQPQFRTLFHLNSWFYTGLSLGYQIDLKGKLHLEGEPEAFLIDLNGENIRSNWSGFRGSLIFGFQL